MGEKLWVYLATYKATVSAILVQQEEEEPYPMYYNIQGVWTSLSYLENINHGINSNCSVIASLFLVISNRGVDWYTIWAYS